VAPLRSYFPETVSHAPELLLSERAWLRGLVATLVRDPTDADDLEQDVSLAALTHPPAHEAAPRGWLAAVARNLVQRGRRSAARRQRREASVARREAQEAVDDVVARAQAHRQVVDAVLQLDEPYRAVVLLRFFENHKPAAIAAQLGCPVATVRTRLQRGLSLLRGQLEREWGGRERWLALFGFSVAVPTTGVASAGSAAAAGVAWMNLQSKLFLAFGAVLVSGLGYLAWPDDPAARLISEAPSAALAVAPDAGAELSSQTGAASLSSESSAKPGPPLADARRGIAKVVRSWRRIADAELPPGDGCLVRVVDMDGTAVPDATVLRADGVVVLKALNHGKALELHQGDGATAQTLLLGATDRNGFLRLPRDVKGCYLIATAKDRASGRATLSVDAHDKLIETYLTLVLEEPVRIHGDVTAGNKPAAGATVRIAVTGDAKFATVKADAGGRFACSLAPNPGFDLGAALGELQSNWTRTHGSGFERLELTGPLLVRGTVADPHGSPLADASVQAHVVGRYQTAFPAADALARAISVQTDAQGRYALTLYGEADYLVMVRHPEWSPPPPARFGAFRQQVRDVHFQMGLWGKMVGDVREPDGRPVAGARIKVAVASQSLEAWREHFKPAVPQPQWSATTDARGNYEIGQLRSEFVYDVVCELDPALRAPPLERKNVPATNQSFTVDRQPQGRWPLRLRVTNAAGEPVTGDAVLRIHSRGLTRFTLPQRHGVALRAGSGDGPWLRGQQTVAADLCVPGVGCATLEPWQVRLDQGEVTVTLEPACRIEVACAFGGALITATRHSRPDAVPLTLDPVRADRHGVVVFDHLTPGMWHFTAPLPQRTPMSLRELWGVATLVAGTVGYVELR
jgi:RNA polymerase sigma factor (sigma-70 family)